jgi:hypothetical protein
MSSDRLARNLLGEPGMGAHKSCSPSSGLSIVQRVAILRSQVALVIVVETSQLHSKPQSQRGEQTAQTCAMAWFRQLRNRRVDFRSGPTDNDLLSEEDL